MPDIRGLLILAILIVAGLGLTGLVGSLLEQRALLRAETPR
ncbi:MAG TPA: hypothetical protein VGM96_04005 [Reyranella sp.]|jgi:hypothetical protein